MNGRGAYRATESRTLQPTANAIYRTALASQGLDLLPGDTEQDCALTEFAAGYDAQLGIDVLLNFSSGLQSTMQEKFLTTGDRYSTITVEYYQNWRTEEPGDWFKLRVDYYFVGYHQRGATAFDKWILLDWPAVKRATSRNLIPWQENKNTRDGARASFRYANFWDIPKDCVIDGAWPDRKADPPTIDWTARNARARAFVKEGLKLGQTWASRTYNYKNEPE